MSKFNLNSFEKGYSSLWPGDRQIVFCDVFDARHEKTDRSLSLSYQKKDVRAGPHPSFFWYDDFSRI